MVGLIVKSFDISYNDAETDNLGEMNKKMKIYACDVEPDFTSDSSEPDSTDSSWRFVSKICH